MIDYTLLLAVAAGIGLLLLLILYFRIQAFISLLIASIAIGLLAGMPPQQIIQSMQTGMGGTLGFVATIVGLGAMFGALLEHSGGAHAIAQWLIRSLGTQRAPLAMAIAGFVVAIPVFFDVAFILLVPVVYAMQRESGKSLLLYAIPLLAGLAITHAFIPPTPGPVAVADILGADLGWVILAGFITGIPTLLISGLWFGRRVAKQIQLAAPLITSEENRISSFANWRIILIIIAVPIVLILTNTILETVISEEDQAFWVSAIQLLGHPFSALIVANLIAWYFLGIRRGMSKEELFKITTNSMAPAGSIILLTGAGGVLKQILVDTGSGEMLALSLTQLGIPVLFFAFLAAGLVRILQGSATVAMITSAGLVAPLLAGDGPQGFSLALLVIAIAAGASMFSHVNDSGFWLVSQYLGMSERQTFQSWTVMTVLLGFVGFSTVVLLSLF